MSVRRGSTIIAGLPIIDGSLNTTSINPIQNQAVANAVNDLNGRIDNIIGGGNFLFSVELSEAELSEPQGTGDHPNYLKEQFEITFPQAIDPAKTSFNFYYVLTTATTHFPVGYIFPCALHSVFGTGSNPVYVYFYSVNSTTMKIKIPTMMIAHYDFSSYDIIRYSTAPTDPYNYVKLVVDVYKLRN